MNKATLTLLPLCAALVGCETAGLSPREHANNYAAMINGVYQKLPPGNGTVRITPPVRIAVAQIGETAPQMSFVTELQKSSTLVQTVTSVPMPGDKSSTGYGTPKDKSPSPEDLAARIESARKLSHDLNADYLLLIGGAVDTYQTRNALAFLDVTIVGGAIFPSVDVRADGKASGALIDVESGRVVLLANAEAKGTGLTPSYFANDKQNQVSADLRDKLLKNLASDFLVKLEDLSKGKR